MLDIKRVCAVWQGHMARTIFNALVVYWHAARSRLACSVSKTQQMWSKLPTGLICILWGPRVSTHNKHIYAEHNATFWR